MKGIQFKKCPHTRRIPHICITHTEQIVLNERSIFSHGVSPGCLTLCFAAKEAYRRNTCLSLSKLKNNLRSCQSCFTSHFPFIVSETHVTVPLITVTGTLQCTDCRCFFVIHDKNSSRLCCVTKVFECAYCDLFLCN